MASARVKALGSLASVVCASVLVLACTPTTPGPNPTPSSSGSAPAEQASRVVVDGPVTAVKGKTIVPLCNGVPAPERVVTEKVRVAITPPATVVLPFGARFTVCAPEAYQPTKPVPADRTPVKVRMYYTNPGPISETLAGLINQVGNDTSDKDLSVVSEVVIDGELGVKALSLARMLLWAPAPRLRQRWP